MPDQIPSPAASVVMSTFTSESCFERLLHLQAFVSTHACRGPDVALPFINGIYTRDP